MKDTTLDDISNSFADELHFYAAERGFQEDIEYSIYHDEGEYKIKIIRDSENILKDFLERMND